jgi:hypothetical protein
MRRSILLTVLAAMAAFAGACTDTTSPVPNKPATPTPTATASPTASPVPGPSGSPVAGAKTTDSLVGKWNGPEGTYLNVTKKGEKFEIEVKNLDGSKTYEGTAKGEVIEFTRNGKTETVKHATGEETGMKDMLKETNCVVITKGSEGFCQQATTTAKPAAK